MNLRITDVPLPVRLVYETPLTDDELLQFSGGNEVVWIERESDGTLYVKPIWAAIESAMFAKIIGDLGLWTKADGRGKMLGRCGYLLPDGSMRGSPVSWVLKERIAPFEQEGHDCYPRLAPDFIMEIMSVFDDRLPTAQDGPMDRQRRSGRVVDRVGAAPRNDLQGREARRSARRPSGSAGGWAGGGV